MARRNLVLLLVLSTLAVGCSSGQGAAESTSGSSPIPVTLPADAPPATLAMPVGVVDATDPYCEALGSIEALDAVPRLAGDDDGAVEAAVEVASGAVAQVALVAPSEIAADWTVIARAYGDLFDAYRDAGYDFAAMMAQPTAAGLLEHLGGRQVVEAGDRVEQHAQAACGISVGLGRIADEVAAPDAGAGLSPDAAQPVDGLLDDEAARIGALLLTEFSISATTEQQICFGRAISDPSAVDGATGEDGEDGEDPFARYRSLAGGCGIDTSALR